ncbi:uncharacterized protein METZ01_LOCUS305263 [marine metagenome]|uniref:DUF998 domain-containing protein n=1 Tax=marine metagenome TaxID=408172 RepID=A0A382MU73_9ZZZZ
MDETKTYRNGGLLLLVGSVVTFLPTLFQILLGGIPEAPMFDSIRKMMLADKSLSHAYALASSIGLVMSLYGLVVLHSFLKDALSHMGLVLCQVGYTASIMAWSLDHSTMWLNSSAPMGIAMGFIFGLFAINGAGLALIAYAASCNDNFHTILSKGFAFVAVSAAVGFSISLFVMDNNDMSTMEPVFGIMALFEFVRVTWGVSIGIKLREMK